jgi:hypothetical protein
VFCDGVTEPVVPLWVLDVYFRPRRRDEHALMVPVGLSQSSQHRFASQVLKGSGGVNQSSVEEDPTPLPARGGAVREGLFDGTARKGSAVQPRKRRAITLKLFLDNSTARLAYNCVAAPGKLHKQRGLAASGASRNHYKMFQAEVLIIGWAAARAAPAAIALGIPEALGTFLKVHATGHR